MLLKAYKIKNNRKVKIQFKDKFIMSICWFGAIAAKYANITRRPPI